MQCHDNRLQQVIAPITINYKQLNEWPELGAARAGGAGTPVRFTVSITRRLTSAGLQQEQNSILPPWTVSLPGAPNPSWRSLFDITKPKSYPSTTETKTKPKMSKYMGVSTTANAMVDGKPSGATLQADCCPY